ncbi:luciferin sulfotransferase-like isoform X2 [Neocloeon triangulifer]|uniref:luciferin sulfotransferase-like isoform X2 n=1 Tax=Neocloeon triangulifer TaxID=2078957 RepID=UPI00286F2CEF|nr:luciferin sulfotransferase-like isoform X2 [Neocloeon triangulifer]
MSEELVRLEEFPEGNLKDLLYTYFVSSFRKGYIRAEGTTLPSYFSNFTIPIKRFAVRKEDTWVFSFPKCGTTWTQEMVWCIANDLDFEAAKVPLQVRFPFLDHTTLFDYEDLLSTRPDVVFPPHVLDSIGFLDNLPSPRYIKTHFPWSLLPTKQFQDEKPKLIYVARNPKDACVSYYHHSRLLEGYRGTFDEFCELFLGDSLCFAPFWKHVLEFWKRRDEPNFLFVKYEDMKNDLPSVIRKTAEFLGKNLSDAKVEILTEHLSFNSMKNNPAVNYEDVVEINRKYNLIDKEEIEKGAFMRKGSVGDYKGQMSKDMISRFDNWTETNLKGTGLSFNL